MNCKFCGVMLYKFDRTCPKCGAPVPVADGAYVFNKDWKLRDSMWKWDERMEEISKKYNPNWEKDAGDGKYGVRHFANLDANTLEKMIELGFADPEEKQNEAPTIGEFLEWMKVNPSYKAHGYVVCVERNDYRLSVEGVDGCGKDWEEVRRFQLMFQDADEFDIEENYQRAWYD